MIRRRSKTKMGDSMTITDNPVPLTGSTLAPYTCTTSSRRSPDPAAPPAYSVTARPGLLIVPGGQYQVMISMASRPAMTAGSASASCLDSSRDPVR
jgi:hypothetical protein